MPWRGTIADAVARERPASIEVDVAGEGFGRPLTRPIFIADMPEEAACGATSSLGVSTLGCRQRVAFCADAFPRPAYLLGIGVSHCLTP